MRVGRGGEMHFRESLVLERAARAGSALGWARLSTPVRRIVEQSVVGIFRADAIEKLPTACQNAGLARIFGLPDEEEDDFALEKAQEKPVNEGDGRDGEFFVEGT
jgi:hypothetical protein